jgi:hypothetical protein
MKKRPREICAVSVVASQEVADWFPKLMSESIGSDMNRCNDVPTKGVLQLLKRLRPALRLIQYDSDEEGEEKPVQAQTPKAVHRSSDSSSGDRDLYSGTRKGCAPTESSHFETKLKAPRKHSRQNLAWSDGRKLLCLGVNECTRALGA